MKKICACLLAVILLVCCIPVSAEKDYDSVTVGTYTPLTGYFFTDMWGSSTSDIDVRDLLHGYSLVNFQSTEGAFATNNTVVSGFVVTENATHDHVYSIALCDDLKYSDGSPITAWDYAFTLLLTADPVIAALDGKQKDVSYLAGAEAYRAGESAMLSGVRVLSDYLMEITVSHEALPFFYELSYLDINPYPVSVLAEGNSVKDDGEGVYLEKALEAETLKEKLFGENGYVSHPSVVSGPYTLTSFDGEKAVLSLNPYFKGDAEGNKPTLKTITYVPVTAANAAEKLASGEIDLINKAVSTEATTTARELVGNGFSVSSYPRTGLSQISFCCESEKVADASVRQALATVIDKEGFTKEYAGDSALVSDGFYGLGQWMYQVVSGAMPAPVTQPGENASAKEKNEYTKSLNAWEKLNLDKVETWDGTAKDAVKILTNGGWIYNEQGNRFDANKDTVRARKGKDGQLTTLTLKLCCPAGVGLKDMLTKYFATPAQEIGIQIVVEEVEWEELLNLYYRVTERDCDMIYIASNFDAAFDPAALFNPATEAQGYENRTGITDEKLYKRALDMRETEPGDTLAYCQKWIAFQERFSEVMPVIPIYTNVYFDFYADALQNYEVSSYLNWSGAIIKAYMSDVVDDMPTKTENVA